MRDNDGDREVAYDVVRDEPEPAEPTPEQRKAKAREVAGDAERGLVSPPPVVPRDDLSASGAVERDPA